MEDSKTSSKNLFGVVDNPNYKFFFSKKCNYIFNKKNGVTQTWGSTKEEDPDYCEFGPQILDVEISEVCNLKCQACYKTNGPEGRNMSLSTFKELLKKVNKNKTLTQIAFGIGSIDGNPELWDILEYTRSQDVVPNITINGYDLTDEHINKFSKLLGAIAVSHYNDDICFNAVKKLTDVGMTQVNIHQILSLSTYKDCLNLMDKINNDQRLSKLNALILLMLKPKGGRNNLEQLKSSKDYKDLILYSFSKNIRLGMDSCSASCFVEAIKNRNDFEQLQMLIEPCESSLLSLYVNVEGKVFPCSFTEGEDGWNGVNVLEKEDFIKDVWHSQEIIRFREMVLNNKDCNNCRQCPIFDLKMERE